MEKKTLVLGVIGSDVHAVGNKILYHAFTEAGFEVANLGVMVSQEEFIAAAIETGADAIVIGSLYGQGELDCRGMREKCVEAGLGEIPLLIGGNIVIGKQNFAEVEKRFKDMGFTMAFPPNTAPEAVIRALKELLGVPEEKAGEISLEAPGEGPEEGLEEGPAAETARRENFGGAEKAEARIR